MRTRLHVKPNERAAHNPVGRLLAIRGSALFLVLAPGSVAGLVPWWLSRWRLETPMSGWLLLRFLGGLLIPAGVPVLVDSFTRFALQGVGTPREASRRHRAIPFCPQPYVCGCRFANPWPRRGLGQSPDTRICRACLAGVSRVCLGVGGPTLPAGFSPEYEQFCGAVPRWIPRLHPWPGI